jgi:hypothetical protein
VVTKPARGPKDTGASQTILVPAASTSRASSPVAAKKLKVWLPSAPGWL